jgi:hypothetical protein
VTKTAHSSREESDEDIDFYIKHLVGDDLSEDAASELKDQAKALGYTSEATIFVGGKNV